MSSKSDKFKRILTDPLKKNIIVIGFEFINESVKHKRIAQEYFSRLCYRKNYPSLRNYCTDKIIGKLQLSNTLHSQHSRNILLNKVAFYRFCLQHQLPTPKVIAYTVDKKGYLIDDSQVEITETNFFELVKDWINKSTHQSIFLKPVDTKGGVGAFRIDSSNINDTAHIQQVFTTITDRDYIIQETLIQHPDVAAINPDSINTIRIDTYKPIDQPSRVFSAIMRFGRKGYVVDNPGSSTGFFISLDLKTHTLKALGLQLPVVGNHTYSHHPDTNIKLDGYQIPYVNQVVELVNKACDLLNDRLVGWDICVGIDGPIIIEGNHNYHIAMQEVAYGGYMNHPEFVKMLKQENII